MPTCEVCGSDAFELIATRIREGEGRILHCAVCGLDIQDLGWSAEELQRYYNEEYQETNSLDFEREQTPREHFDDRLKTVGSLVEKVRPLLRPGMRVLEVGCGAGELLASIREDVAEVVGVELHQGFVDFMNEDLGIEAYAQDVNTIDFGDRRFDLVISIATLDHLPNPLETIETMKGLLAPGGAMYLEVPNRNEAMNLYLPQVTREAFNTFFWHRAHLFYFTADTFARLLAKAGLSADVTYRHQYTLVNLLNWYFRGEPTKTFVQAATQTGLFAGASAFEAEMNELFGEIEPRFQRIMESTGGGDTLCVVARVQ